MVTWNIGHMTQNEIKQTQYRKLKKERKTTSTPPKQKKTNKQKTGGVNPCAREG